MKLGNVFVFLLDNKQFAGVVSICPYHTGWLLDLIMVFPGEYEEAIRALMPSERWRKTHDT